MEPPFLLDGRPVPVITAYLFHAGGHGDPARMVANANKSFQGPIPLGMGFTFDDDDKDGVATSIAEMNRLIAKNNRNAERIFPYIGGEEVLNSPTHAHHRYVIHFGEMSEEEARNWPDLVRILEEKVKPDRLKNKREVRAKYWWRFGENAPALFRSIQGMQRVLTHPFTSTYVCFAFLPAGTIISGPHNVFALDGLAHFCAFSRAPTRCGLAFLRHQWRIVSDILRLIASRPFHSRRLSRQIG